jgi:hypothetical protein
MSIAKNINVLVQSRQPYSVELITLLNKRYGWQPKIWLTDYNSDSQIKRVFPEVKTLPYVKSVKGFSIYSESLLNRVQLDDDLLQYMQSFRSIAFFMMNRNDSEASFSIEQKSAFFSRLIRIWIKTLELTQVEVIMFEEEPHQTSDYVLYLVCQYKRIQTIMFRRVFFQDRIYAVKNFTDTPGNDQAKSPKYDEEVSDEIMSPFLQDHFNAISSKYYHKVQALSLWNVEEYSNKKTENILNIIQDFKKRYSFLIDILLNRYENDQKEKKSEIYRSNMSYFHLRRNMKKARLKNHILREYYCSKTIEPPNIEREPYVYFPLHYQPERTTCPLGGKFVQQEIVIEYLLKSLPAEWKIYVKEHPRQYSNSNTKYSNSGRSRNYYDKIIGNDRVRLLPFESNSFKLIDESICVATVTGTVGWEAIIRGKYVMVFGYPWYLGCEGIFETRSPNEIEKALITINSGKKPNIEKVKHFATNVENNTVVGAVGGIHNLERKGLNTLDNARAHFEALVHMEDLIDARDNNEAELL